MLQGLGYRLGDGTSKEADIVKRVLVLGPRSIARILGDQLAKRGFTIEIQEESGVLIPTLADPRGLSKLREILQAFASSGNAAEEDRWVHPGISVWAERPELPSVAAELGLKAICPGVRVLTTFGNKLNLLEEAEKLGIPNLVLSPDPIQSIREIERLIERFAEKFPEQAENGQPFPFVLKSVKGESNLRLHVVHSREDVQKNLPLWIEQLRRNSGEVLLFAERYVEGARHMVIPFARFADGRFKAFPIVDASLQSRFRKILEMCPALTEKDAAPVRENLAAWARALAEHTGFVGLGVLEFFVDGDRAYLVEGSARLNTEFHLWERVAGTEVVAWQLATLGLDKTTAEPECKPSRQWAFGLALRFYAEDSVLQLPQPGVIYEISAKREWTYPTAAAELNLPDLAEGETARISPLEYGMIGSLWVGAKDRAQALAVAKGVLDEMWIAGSLQTNERFLSELIAHPWVREGVFHASFVDEEFVPSAKPSPEVLRDLVSICVSHPENARSLTAEPGVVRWGVGNQAVSPSLEGLHWVGAPTFSMINGMPAVSGSLELEAGVKVRAAAYPLVPDRWQVRIGLWAVVVRRVEKVAGQKPRPRILALVPGKVHSILFRANATAPAHQPILILESLRILIPHALPSDVRITRWKVSAEEEVSLGQELAEFEVVT
jgi:biotin carboxylase